MDLKETCLRSEAVYDGCLLHARRDEVRLPDGGTSVREYLRHGGAVCVLPLTDDGRVVMERQYRYAVGRTVTELPAGKLDSPEEDPLEAANGSCGRRPGPRPGSGCPWANSSRRWPTAPSASGFLRPRGCASDGRTWTRTNSWRSSRHRWRPWRSRRSTGKFRIPRPRHCSCGAIFCAGGENSDKSCHFAQNSCTDFPKSDCGFACFLKNHMVYYKCGNV